jgi:hypothetical protein
MRLEQKPLCRLHYNSFEAQLQARQFLFPHVGTYGKPQRTHANEYEYYLCGRGLFYSDDDDIDGYNSFVMEDDRYYAEFGYIGDRGRDGWLQNVSVDNKNGRKD